MTLAPVAFRVVGSAENPRRIVSYRKAMVAYAHADPGVRPELQAYLSAFTFPLAFKDHVEKTGSAAGYTGPVGVPALHFDIDRDDLDAAIRDARRLAAYLQHRYAADPLTHFSGSKGFHISVPTAGFIEPAADNNLIAKLLACRLAGDAGIAIDEGIYDRVRLWRAPNSKHRKTGLHKVVIDIEDLLHVDPVGVRHRAAEPIAYDPPDPASAPARLIEDWHAAMREVRGQPGAQQPLSLPVPLVAGWNAATKEVRGQTGAQQPLSPTAGGDRRLNQLTRDLIVDPISVQQGDRHRRLFSAAANLAEFETIDQLIAAILTEPGLDTGLPPVEVDRQIRCGINHARRPTEGGTS